MAGMPEELHLTFCLIKMKNTTWLVALVSPILESNGRGVVTRNLSPTCILPLLSLWAWSCDLPLGCSSVLRISLLLPSFPVTADVSWLVFLLFCCGFVYASLLLLGLEVGLLR